MLRPLCIFLKFKNILKNAYSSIAQSVERMTVNHDVAGSSPAGGAKDKSLCQRHRLLSFSFVGRTNGMVTVICLY